MTEFFDPADPNGVFANTHLVELTYRGLTFGSVEHLYQWFKFDYADASPATRAFAEKIRKSRNADRARVLGRLEVVRNLPGVEVFETIRHALEDGVARRPDWEAVKMNRMRTALRLKFAHPELNAELLAANALVYLGNSLFWGKGRSGKGRNVLGMLLNELREENQLVALLDDLESAEDASTE